MKVSNVSMSKEVHEFLRDAGIPADLPVTVRPYRCRKTHRVMVWRLFQMNPKTMSIYGDSWLSGLFSVDRNRDLSEMSSSLYVFFSMFDKLKV